ncbi:hypothetical protein TWF569_010331 [Orbilia oligospora]|uniref:Uncharacterized protein n=1 Tax=Orbilia oligospora TaxID=2813651 RepID=A0A7C8NM70_ORBOL|nr:hypothetical protein TWF103_004067 [Orbilia oligospora]KAF3113349.1 hypothetical protein TWF102_000013 [Orbilia oligospora]KAF3115542.1 hypothetical protein TWF706_005668 [Orbilia oligospora]KAF3133939.1 hypothetical protein TWF569_010331 [Orbilia oligospora]KAF3134470.1 hypothetical protein TWF594_008711 [Orbilia oligospora]
MTVPVDALIFPRLYFFRGGRPEFPQGKPANGIHTILHSFAINSIAMRERGTIGERRLAMQPRNMFEALSCVRMVDPVHAKAKGKKMRICRAQLKRSPRCRSLLPRLPMARRRKILAPAGS